MCKQTKQFHSVQFLLIMKFPSVMIFLLVIACIISGLAATKGGKKEKATKLAKSQKASKSQKLKAQDGFLLANTEESSVRNISSLKEKIYDCSLVVKIWMEMTKEQVDPNGANTDDLSLKDECCEYQIGQTKRSSGLPGVYCDIKGDVYGISWYKRGLASKIPVEIGDLKNLRWM